MLGEYDVGVRSVAEAESRGKISTLDIPEPLFNPELYLPNGTFLARPDAYWKEAALAFEVDSREHHGDMEGWEYTQRRHARMTAHGLLVVHASPRRIHSDWPVLASELTDTYRLGRTRPLPELLIRAA